MTSVVYVYNTFDSSLTYTSMPDYAEQVSYDPNGNILTYFRNGTTANGGPLGMDSLTYKYQQGNNKLDHVNDAVAATNYSVDIDNEDTLNYRYDQIGNLTKDSAAGIDSIYWTVYGKIQRIDKHNGDKIKFAYGPDGNRIMKEVKHGGTNKQTHYVHDATGNIMATYQWINKDTLNLDELMMYGSSRLGTVGVGQYLTDTITRDSTWLADNPPLTNPNTDSVVYYTNGLKQYELTNHLGNVLLTLTNRHIPLYVFGGFATYKPEVASAQDYYPFGSLMPGRQYTGTGYRYGFNGQEKDDEVQGASNTMAAQFWEYDSRLGRRWNRDPKPNASLSDYAAFANNPVWFTDEKGDSAELIIGKPYTDRTGKDHPYGHAALRVFNAQEGYNMVYDFGRYGKVDWNQTTGEGILNVYTDGGRYLQSEMKERSSVGYSAPTTVAEDKQMIETYKTQTDAGEVYQGTGGEVPNGGGKAYKLQDSYNIFDNNCLTKSSEGLNKIDQNWVGKESDPREALKKMEGSYQGMRLTRTEYNKGGQVKTTFTPAPPPTFKPIPAPQQNNTVPVDNTRVAPKPLNR